MIEGRHGGSGAACGPRPKLPHFIYFTQTDWLWVRPRLSLHYSTPPPITQYTSHTTKSSFLTVRQNVEFFCFTCGCTYSVQYQVNTMAVSWPPETIQRRFFFVRPWIKTDLSYRKIAPKTGRVTFWRTKKVASGKYNSFAACVVFSTNYYYFYITLCVSTFKNWHSVSPSPYI